VRTSERRRRSVFGAGEEALVDRLAATIHSRVLSGEIASGTRLRQEALAEEFGVSRTPVREALRKLQANGVLELVPNRGALVRAPDPRRVRETYEVRAELEGFAAELAATRIRDAELARLREAQELFRAAIRDNAHDEWMQANDAFHDAVHEAAGNTRLRATLGVLRNSFPRDLTWIVLGESSHLLEQNVGEHEAVLEAIERRDPRAARRLMSAHVLHAGELIRLRLEQRSGAAG
jgi:DNA-binding GntR family transcriptional regulator